MDRRGRPRRRRGHHHGLRRRLPVFAGKRYLDWVLDDPADTDIDTVRRIRDEIERKVRGLLEELGIPAG